MKTDPLETEEQKMLRGAAQFLDNLINGEGLRYGIREWEFFLTIFPIKNPEELYFVSGSDTPVVIKSLKALLKLLESANPNFVQRKP